MARQGSPRQGKGHHAKVGATHCKEEVPKAAQESPWQGRGPHGKARVPMAKRASPWQRGDPHGKVGLPPARQGLHGKVGFHTSGRRSLW